jgi:hypothetical protein
MTKKYVTQLIIVDADGEIITAANGQISSNNGDLVKTIKREVLLGTKTQLIPPFGRQIQASLDPADLVGLTAALFSARPGRTKLLEAPAEVWEWMREDMEDSEGDSFPDVLTLEESRTMFSEAGNFHSSEKAVNLLLGLDEEIDEESK